MLVSGSSDMIPVICKMSDKTLFPTPIGLSVVAVVVVVEVVVEEMS